MYNFFRLCYIDSKELYYRIFQHLTLQNTEITNLMPEIIIRNPITQLIIGLITVKAIIQNKLNNMSQKFQWKAVKTVTQSTSRPCPRWGHSSCAINNDIVLFGGYANSVYMNDVWVFDSQKMEWRQIKTTGTIPSQRSNCSLNYDATNNRLVLFGGGGQNKKRYNQINLLDWQTKEWSCINFQQNETAPWQRTYHSSELLYPYLITFGGQGITDLDDLWVFNFENSKWQEVKINKDSVQPCGRRFHTSCLIGNQFYVIAGCYSKYRPLNDVYSIDLTKLKQTGSVEGLQWKQKILNQQGFLTRWGQSSCVIGTDIYIFGGRFSNDLNDMLIIDTQKNKIKVLKVQNDSVPKPRRRSCLNAIGNCLVMFGGFNSDYYNDLHYINVTGVAQKLKKNKKSQMKMFNFDQKDLLTDVEIKASNNKVFYCHKGILMQYFLNQNKFSEFIQLINGKQEENQLKSLLKCIYSGYGEAKLLNKYFINLPSTSEQEENDFFKKMQDYQTHSPLQSLLSIENQKPKKTKLIQLNNQQFQRYSQQNEQNQYKDVQLNMKSLIDGSKYSKKINKMLFSRSSKFFSTLISRKFKDEELNILVPICDINKMEIITNWIISGHLVVPSEMNHKDWINFYKLTDYLCLSSLKAHATYQLYPVISQSSLKDIFEFSLEYNLQDLAISCARYQISKSCLEQINQSNKYYKISYEQNRFQIKQEAITKSLPPIISNKKNSSTEDMQQQRQNNGEAVCNH